MLLRIALLAPAFLAACSGGEDDAPADRTGTDTDADTDTFADTGVAFDGYAFPSRFDGQDSVAYDGQVFRQLLIDEMKRYLGDLTDRIDTGALFPAAGEVEDELEFYFSFDSTTSGGVPLTFSSSPAPLQAVYDDVSTDKDLVGKLAGNDPVGQHKDWSTEFVGWAHPAVTTPESLVRLWFAQIDAAAVARSTGVIPVDPTGAPLSAVYLTPTGVDLQQLLEKFLRVAIAFSQGADDYLDDDEPGKGLRSDHTAADGSANYTPLEHQWDEGFGYFGAARTFGAWTDDTIASPAYADVNGDGSIDLLTEVNFGHATDAANRDLGAVAATDFTQQAWDGLYRGRALLASTTTDLTPEQLTELQGYRDQAVLAWEKAIAATVVHGINDTLQDMDAFGTQAYRFEDHAKHWSEMKGFALAFQFNPRSPMSDADFARLHSLIGPSPALPTAPGPLQTQYRNDLLAARDLIGTAYGFDPANLGDDDGLGGW